MAWVTRLTVRRPDGAEEIVTRPDWLTDAQVEAMRTATRAAGRGEILSASHVTVTAPARPRTMRSLYAEAHAAEACSDGRCPSCGTYCSGDCRS